MKLLPTLVLSMLALIAPSRAIGQTGTTEEVERVTLYGAREPSPALKYELLPGLLERRPGNAAVYYGKVTAEQNNVFANKELWENIEKWTEAPLADLKRDEISAKVDFGTIYEMLDKAARCETCDWQLPIREEEFYLILLPEVQQTRSFARLLAVRARAQIADGQFDEAVKTLRTGYALARNVAQAPTLINGLVGIAIASIMDRQARELIQQPGAPNLYWAYTMLPRPLIDMRPGVEAERDALALSFPELRELEDTSRDPSYWTQSLQQFWSKLVQYESGRDVELRKRPETLTLLCMKGYPMARRSLIENGLTPEQVDAMPVPQVIAQYAMRTYEEIRDELFKWYYVPYSVAQAHDQDKQWSNEDIRRREIIPVASIFLPAIPAVRTAAVRSDRQVAVLRTLEALRMHAAAQDGRLPDKLSDVTIVPVPDDPVTGTPFQYSRRGDLALLEGPALPGAPLRIEIHMVKGQQEEE